VALLVAASAARRLALLAVPGIADSIAADERCALIVRLCGRVARLRNAPLSVPQSWPPMRPRKRTVRPGALTQDPCHTALMRVERRWEVSFAGMAGQSFPIEMVASEPTATTSSSLATRSAGALASAWSRKRPPRHLSAAAAGTTIERAAALSASVARDIFLGMTTSLVEPPLAPHRPSHGSSAPVEWEVPGTSARRVGDG
jgi:hypothetical protein